MDFKQIVILTLCAVIQMINLCHADPCLNRQCGLNTVCRLQAVRCIMAPCPPIAVCESSVIDRSKCGTGSGPVLGMDRTEIFCGRGPDRRPCPDHTVCRIDPLDRFAVCCWQGPVTKPVTKPVVRPVVIPVTKPVVRPKPGRCPRAQPGFGICIARCSSDADCPGRMKCCGSCPRVCKAPALVQKPGRCPWYFPRRQCVQKTDQCITDQDCSLNKKCCSTPCGRMCSTPTPPQRYPWWYWMGFGRD